MMIKPRVSFVFDNLSTALEQVKAGGACSSRSLEGDD